MTQNSEYGVRIKILVDGLEDRAKNLPMHTSEVVVGVMNAENQEEEVIVDRRSLSDDVLSIGYPVETNGDRLLIELPREMANGSWRIWVPEASVVPMFVAA